MVVDGNKQCRAIGGEAVLGQIKCDRWLTERHVLHDLDHGAAIVVGIGWRGLDPDIDAPKEATDFVVVQPSEKSHAFVDLELLSQSPDRWHRLSRPGDQTD